MNKLKFIHARCSENGTINGKKGDTKNEVGVTDYYEHKLGWYFLAPYNPSLLPLIVKYGLMLSNNKNVGYGQSDRLSLLEQLKKHNFNVGEIELCNCDCSSFIRCCIILACLELGINFDKIYNFNTATELTCLLNSNLFYKTTYKKSGVIAVTRTKGHTAIIYEETPIEPPKTNKNITQIAKEVIQGKYGNGKDRKNNLESLGFNYLEVQKEVNRLLKGGM